MAKCSLFNPKLGRLHSIRVCVYQLRVQKGGGGQGGVSGTLERTQMSVTIRDDVWNGHFCARPTDNLWVLEMGQDGPFKPQHPIFLLFSTFFDSFDRKFKTVKKISLVDSKISVDVSFHHLCLEKYPILCYFTPFWTPF